MMNLKLIYYHVLISIFILRRFLCFVNFHFLITKWPILYEMKGESKFWRTAWSWKVDPFIIQYMYNHQTITQQHSYNIVFLCNFQNPLLPSFNQLHNQVQLQHHYKNKLFKVQWHSHSINTVIDFNITVYFNSRKMILKMWLLYQHWNSRELINEK